MHSLCQTPWWRAVCEANAPQLEDPRSFVGRWIQPLRAAHAQVTGIKDQAARGEAMEKAGILVSLEKQMTYPFVAEAVAAATLALHRVWCDIATGSLEVFDATQSEFAPI